MIKITPASELDIMIAYHGRKAVYDGEVDALENCIAAFRAGHPTVAIWADGQVIGVMGFSQYWRGVGVVSAIFTDDVNKYPLAFYRAVRRRLDELMTGLHRVEMTVKLDYEQGIRFAEALGFEREGILRKYTADGSDCVMFGRIK